ncbi:MAG: hypothetical protein BMS9Abin28_1696 [Anaerolineae bacterium]|nr:MAG: hypothetical protein BMS9Abin28_1696 [Anaerolineae bacterium]
MDTGAHFQLGEKASAAERSHHQRCYHSQVDSFREALKAHDSPSIGEWAGCEIRSQPYETEVNP